MNRTDLIIMSDSEDAPEFLNLYDGLIDKINLFAKEQKNEIRQLKKMYQKQFKQINKQTQNKRVTGFTKTEVVPKKLAKLIGIEYGCKMNRTELTKKVYSVLKDRGLYYKKDKRVLRVDSEIKKIFNLGDDVNNITDPNDKNGFNFYNIQKYIAECYKNDKLKKTNLIQNL